MSFYVTLPSNSSTKFFPDNTLTSYTTKLQNQIDLDGLYEVAMTEIIFPFNWTQLLQGKISVGKINDNESVFTLDLSKMKANTNKDLADIINKEINYHRSSLKSSSTDEPISFKSIFNYNTQSLKFNCNIDKDSFIEFDKDAWDYFGTRYARNEGKSFVSMKNRINIINNINMIYIYSDICSYQYVGDTFAPLLNVVAVPSNVKYGDYIVINYSTPHYIPVISNVLDTIEINLRSDIGDFIHFDSGKVLIKLHFRPKSLY